MRLSVFTKLLNSSINRFPKCFLLISTTLSFATYGTDFNQCKQQLTDKAIAEGYSPYISEQVIANLTAIERVKVLDKRQPEFSESFDEYINKRVSDYRVKQGQEKLKQYDQLLTKLTKQYGVPKQYIVAFWGLETNYGRHKGKMSVLNSIATLACDPRRSDYFTAELFQLFDLIEANKVTVEQLQGSWAGAMGHMQFMPTALKTYGIDGDNDGKLDVWDSEVDALTSAANYLQQIGWQFKERWGREVLLPDNFDFSQVQIDKPYPLSFFKAKGIKTVYGHALADYPIDAELFLPSGQHGPAFLTYPNFDVIMKWNLSKNYAAAVGLLANRLVGAPKRNYQALDDKHRYTREQLKALQQRLQDMGYNTGKPDGIWGPNSRKAIRAFQLANNLVADAYPYAEVFEKADVDKAELMN